MSRVSTSSSCTRLFCCLSLVAALGAGCGDDDNGNTSANNNAGNGRADAAVRGDGRVDAGTPGTTGDAAVGALTEAQVVGVAAAINTGEIGAAQLAQTKAAGKGARDYATMMIDMHTKAQQRQAALGITPAASPQQQTVATMAATALQNLQAAAAGAGFDNAYLESQVMMHSSALGIIDTVLLPSASTAALRAELTTARGEVVAHLAEAESLLASDAGVR